MNLDASGSVSVILQTPATSATLAGTFTFQSSSVTLGTNTTPSTVIQVAVTNASTSLMLGANEAGVSNAPGVAISNINGAFLIEPSGVAGSLIGGFDHDFRAAVGCKRG